MINFNSIKRIYKLNIPNVFSTPISISFPRILSCHLRWIATVIPGTKILLNLAYSVEHKSAIRIEKWVKVKCNDILCNIDQDKIDKNYLVNKTIWTCWWQGEEFAPGVVKKCISRMRKMSNGARVIVVDKTNYENYATLPKDIIELRQAEKMSMAHFSDLLRTNILAIHGGLWVDSTIWMHGLVIEDDFKKQLYSIKFSASPIIKADWGYSNIVFFMCVMGGKNRYFYELIYNMLIHIWRVQPKVVNYLIFDKVVRVLYDAVPKYKEYIELGVNTDELEIISGESKYNLKDTVSKIEFDEFKKSRRYTKLTYKFNYPKKINGQKTLYGWILNTLS